MPYNIEQPMSLKAAQFQPVAFNPTQYEYKPTDFSTLERSLAQREARHNQAIEQQSAVHTALGKIKTQLHRDEETDKWFNDYANNINNQIQEQINVGNYGSAFRIATSLAGETAKDPAVLGRIQANEDYIKEVETQKARRDKGEISQNTFDWWMYNNPYKYEDIKDAKGNVIGGSSWIAETRPVVDLNLAKNALDALKLISPEKGSTTSSRISNADDDGAYSAITKGGGSSDAYERITVKKILDNMDRLMSSTPDGYRQAEQFFEVAKYDLERLRERAANATDPDEKRSLEQMVERREKDFQQNGGDIDYKTFYARMIMDELYANHLAYDWRVHQDDSKTIIENPNALTSNSTRTGGTFNPLTGEFTPTYGTVSGPNVEQRKDYDASALNGAVNGIVERLK